MGKHVIFKKAVLIGTVSCLLGLGACATSTDDIVFTDEEFVEQETEIFDDVVLDDITPEDKVALGCASDDELCVVSDDYLTDQFTQNTDVSEESKVAEKTDVSLVSSDDIISLSRPAGQKAVSVKDKQKTVTKETLTTLGEPMTSSETQEKILYTTVQIPEEIGTTKTTETTLTTTSVTKSSEVSEENTVSEEDEAIIPAGMIPLKKTVTTITETTTKIPQEKKVYTNADFRKMTLAEKVEYGESVQEWEAKAGTTLRGLLTNWGENSGWTVVWKLDRDYNLEAGVIFSGTFTDVASALIRSFARATPAPIGTFHKGNRVLVLSTQEDENER